jgi:hypothetical protein
MELQRIQKGKHKLQNPLDPGHVSQRGAPAVDSHRLSPIKGLPPLRPRSQDHKMIRAGVETALIGEALHAPYVGGKSQRNQ